MSVSPNAKYTASSLPPRDLIAVSIAVRRPVPPSLSTPLTPSAEYEPWKRYLPMSRLPPLTGFRQVLLDRVCQVLHAHRLQPDAARPRQRGEEKALAAEEHVLDSGHGHDVELHRLLEHPDVARMHAQGVAGLQVIGHDFTVELDPGLALTLQALHAKTGAAEHAGPESLLKADRELHT